VFSFSSSYAVPYSQEKSFMPYPTYSPGDYYQVMFDGEGEATVIALLNRMNTGNQLITEMELEIPGNVNIRYIFQDTGEYWNQRYKPLEYKITELSKSKKLTIQLYDAIEQGNVGRIIINYKAYGYVNRYLNFDFDFETIKSPVDIDYIRVAIATDSDIYLRGGQSRTDYRYDGFATTAESMIAGKTEASQEMGRYLDNIQYARGYVKEKRNLDPWESFHVTGSYNFANLWFLTFIWEIAGILAILVFVKFLFLGKIKKAFKKPILPETKIPQINKILRISSISFASALGLLFIWFGLFAGISWMFSGLPWELRSMFSFLMLLIVSVLTIAMFGLPAFYMGKKYGIWEGILTFIATVVWLFIFMFMFVLLITPVYSIIEITPLFVK
ncbi:MAG: hypothetical protein ISS36_04200, partial [Candidatus Aenigmarchaeota archaeon]|nr:hypothetical protein [Candidatus Aenigmarchaeota archaeon]